MNVPSAYAATLDAASAQYHVPRPLLAAQIDQESGWNPNAVSGAGAIGLAQFMPATAAAYGVDPRNPQSSIVGAAHYDADLFARFRSWPAALSAYNAGPNGNFSNPETVKYVNAVLSEAASGQTPQRGAAAGTAAGWAQEGVYAQQIGGAIGGTWKTYSWLIVVAIILLLIRKARR